MATGLLQWNRVTAALEVVAKRTSDPGLIRTSFSVRITNRYRLHPSKQYTASAATRAPSMEAVISFSGNPVPSNDGTWEITFSLSIAVESVINVYTLVDPLLAYV